MEADEAVLTIVPTMALPPVIPSTLQVIAEDPLPAPETVAVKTSAPPVGTFPADGKMLTVIALDGVWTGVEVADGAEALPHAERSKAASAVKQILARLAKSSAAREIGKGACMRNGIWGKACANAVQIAFAIRTRPAKQCIHEFRHVQLGRFLSNR